MHLRTILHRSWRATCSTLWFWLVLILPACCLELNTEESLRDAVVKQPQNAEVRMKLAQWYLKWGQLRKAIDELKDAANKIPTKAWEFREVLGDVYMQWARDEGAAEAQYREASTLNPKARRSVLQYGMIRIWRGHREEAEKLFREAVKSKLLIDPRQRPLEVSRSPSTKQDSPWYPGVSFLPGIAALAAATANITAEYLKWASTRAKDSEVDTEGLASPYGKGRWRHFWIYRPRFEQGVWRSACSYKTPVTCKLLESMNYTGPPGEKLVILRADFDVLEPQAQIRPHCHSTDRETLLMLPLLIPRLGPSKYPLVMVGGEENELTEGNPMLYDATYENEESLPALPDAGASGHDYEEELRQYYSTHGLEDKIASIPEILTKWAGREEKMMREVRKKYLLGWKGERVALRLLLRSSVLKAASRAEVANRTEL